MSTPNNPYGGQHGGHIGGHAGGQLNSRSPYWQARDSSASLWQLADNNEENFTI